MGRILNMTIEPKIFTEVKEILKGFGQTYLTEDGALKRSKLTEDLDNYVPLLMKELLSSEIVRQSYVEEIKVGDKTHEIFKLNQFVELFTYKQYWEDSYTKFSNKIGLTAGGKFIDETADVVLDFPFKDCVLKAGMSKEDAKDSDEAFLNEVIAKTEIDTLLEPKIFVNATRYDKEHLVGQPTDTFSEQDNLIIKGNNLIALHSIKARYAGKVKCIYIDPPYNTGNDSFNYNDNFNHSAWLTFMKNRLEIARELLSDDGSVFVHLDKNEVHYLSVLMDGIFGRKNYIETITVVNNPRGRDYGGIANVNEFILAYRKSDATQLNLMQDSEKKFKYKDELGGFDVLELRNRNSAFHKQNRPNLHYSVFINPDKEDENGFCPISLKKSEEFSVELFPRKSQQGVELVWRWGKPLLSENLNINAIAKKNSDGTFSLMQKYRKNETMARSLWQGTNYNSFEKGTNHLKELFGGEKVFSFPKPESTLKTVFEIGSKEGDLVLDFFAGSATTMATAMKMKRRFIGIEQMDYINTVSVERLKKVIDGEQGGISKAVNWQGGGSFVYAELFEKNQGYLKDVLSSSDTAELNAVYQRMVDGGADFDFRIDLKKFDEEKSELSFEKQKEFLLKIIDKNQLYYQYSEIEDEDVREWVSESDLGFNQEFYGE